MYLRSKPDRTLADLNEDLNAAPGESIRTPNSNVTVSIMDVPSPIVTVKPTNGDGIDVPLTKGGIEALAGWLDVPKPFLSKADPQLQETILNYLLHDSVAHASEGVFRVADDGIREVRSPIQRVIEPSAVVDALAKVLDPSAPVIEFWNTPDEFRLDTVVPDGFDRGVGGDPAVGDLTCGGIRVIQNRKMNHAPQLSGYLYRLACTNGMHMEERDLAIDARGQTVEEVLAEIDAAAHTIMGRIERRIASFYNLRTERTATPEQVLVRLAEEQGISDRVLADIIRRVPSITDGNSTASMFDLVNLVTNTANDPTIARRAGSRLLLERAGGETVIDHAERCDHCQAKLAV